MNLKQYLGISALLISLGACTSTTQQTSQVTADSIVKVMEDTSPVAVEFKAAKTGMLYAGYITLKDALVASNFEQAKIAAQGLTPLLSKHAGCENTAIISQQIENAKDLAAQRVAFTTLSSDLIALFKNAELQSGTIFIQHCPMANKGDGGDWLSTNRLVENPYYGDQMMNCGSVIEEIKAAK